MSPRQYPGDRLAENESNCHRHDRADCGPEPSQDGATIQPHNPLHSNDGRDSDGGTDATTVGLDTGDVRSGSTTRPAWTPNLRIGAYRILSVLGEGSMGVVYRAVQDNPNRVVALKVLKPGGSSGGSLRRFEQEAQLLGRLQHPGVAQIFEAGTSDSGYGPQPFFAMELIEGVPLNRYADGQRLNTRERIELFVKVCEGVHHAHQKGIIHRDLKPSNILVDERGMPKILDFGVALATGGRAEPSSGAGGARQLVGTIPYMSFEQLQGWEAELDTRSDVYALGVIAYQLLCGFLPYDLKKRSVDQAVRIVGETDPPLLGAVEKRFRGDVEIIIAKALRRDKTLRYQSVSDLAADLRRYLSDLPVEARPPSVLYQLRKFTRRNKAVVFGAVAVFLALLTAIIGTSVGLSRARRAEATKTAINDFLINDVLNAADPERLGRRATIRQALDVAARRIEDGALSDQPVVRAAVHMVLGKTYRALGLYDVAERHLQTALHENRIRLGETDSQTLETVNELGLLFMDRGKYDEAETMLRKSWVARKRQRGVDDPDTLSSLHGLASLALYQGLYETAEQLLRQVLEARMRVLKEANPQTLDAMSDLAFVLYREGKTAEAESRFRRTLELQRRVLGDDHPSTLSSMNNLGLLLKSMGRLDEAEGYYRDALDGYTRILGAQHPTTLRSMNNLATLLKTKGVMNEAAELYNQTLEGRRRVLGDDHPDTLTSMNNLAALLVAKGSLDDAESLYRETVGRMQRILGENHPTTITATYALAGVLQMREQYEEAESLLRQVLGLLRADDSKTPIDLSVGLIRLGMFLSSRDRAAEAEPLLRECLAIRTTALPKGDWRVANAESVLGACLVQLGRFEEAEPLLTRSYPVLSARWGASDVHTHNACQRLIDLYDAWGRPKNAAEWRATLKSSADGNDEPSS